MGSIKVLKTNGGFEFNSVHFNDFYRNEGIIHHIITPYIAQHNRVVEKRNKTIMNMFRSRLMTKGMPGSF